MASLESSLASIANHHHLDTIYVFGSRTSEIMARARGLSVTHEHIDADVDIAIQPNRGRRLNAQERVRLVAALEDLFDANRVDLVLLPEANPFLAVEAIRGELLYCSDLDAQAEDELYILRRAGDLAPYERQRWARMIEGHTL
jgi:predicted nucleotidyltransferase